MFGKFQRTTLPSAACLTISGGLLARSPMNAISRTASSAVMPTRKP